MPFTGDHRFTVTIKSCTLLKQNRFLKSMYSSYDHFNRSLLIDSFCCGFKILARSVQRSTIDYPQSSDRIHMNNLLQHTWKIDYARCNTNKLTQVEEMWALLIMFSIVTLSLAWKNKLPMLGKAKKSDDHWTLWENVLKVYLLRWSYWNSLLGDNWPVNYMICKCLGEYFLSNKY